MNALISFLTPLFLARIFQASALFFLLFASWALADPLVISDETLDLGGTTLTAGDVYMFNAVVTNGTLYSDSSFLVAGGSNNISASLAGAASFESTAGITILSESNSYSGGTFIDGGTMILTNAGTLGATTNDLIIAGNATLNLGGTMQTVGATYFYGATIINGTLSSDAGYIGGGP